MKDRALKIINLAVLFQQQRYLVAISFLFYLANGLTLSDFLLFQSIFYFTGLIAEIPAGYIGDIFPRKNVLIFSYVLYMCRIAMWIIMPNYYTILLGEICYGLSKAFYRGVSDGYIYDYLKENSITKLMSDKYGKFNFFMSTGSAISCLIGAWLFKFVGFGILLGIEFLFNSFAVFILFFLPNVPHTGRNLSFGKHIKNIFDIVISALKNPKLNIYLLYGGILTGVTSIFVWNFQPFMKSFALPVYLFGVIYFINHMLRAFGSAGADKVLQKIPLKKVSCFVWLFYLLCFLLMIRVQGMSGYFVCIATLVFVCLVIGVLMIFNVGNISRIHGLISSDIRATVSSIYSMLSSLFSGLFLMLFKSLSDGGSIKISLCIFAILFFFAGIFVRKIIRSEL